MKKIIFVLFIFFLKSGCAFGFGDLKAQLAEKANFGKEESNITGAEISKEKDEINADKIETVNKTTTDNSEVGTIKANANANIKTDVKTKVNSVMKGIENIKTDISANAEIKGVDLSRSQEQSAQYIQNKDGLIGIDILYLLGGISLLICVIMFIIALIIGKFFMKSKSEKILEQKYEEKNLLKAAINELVFFGDILEQQAARKIINKYDNFKLQLGIKD